MENAEGKTVSGGNSHDKDSQCIRVAVHIRPLITTELMVGCTDCIAVVSGEPQVQIGSHTFTFDNVYGSTASPSSAIFSECVTPLVDAFFHGYNATVLAYGQTGSGKTYTMGTNYSGEAASSGIIPRVMETIFSRVEEMKETVEFLIRVSFIEIFKEEVFDLLDPNSLSYSKSEGAALVKHAVPARLPIQIRETGNGGITLAGVIEAEVRTKEEMASYLSRGSLSRATGSTNMNSQSSRSHAIFTICMEQKRNTRCSSKLVGEDDDSDDILCAKLHLVDLAGSERAKRTGADGLRLKEGIHINKGLLALGNVISALGDEKKRKEGGHVPYRDSKLTRLLQDSLGGNSKTVMIACVSPADTNAEETLNTLKYANRARNIQNKAIINRDPAAAQMQRMRSQIEQLQAELLYFRGEGGTPFEELQILRHKISLLEASNAELHRELQERRVTCDHLAQRAIDAQVEKDKLILRIESTRDGKPWENIDSVAGNQEFDLVKTYVSKIQELEGELMRLQSLNKSSHNRFMNSLDLEDDVLHSKSPYLTDLPSVCDDNATSFSGEIEEAEKEMEHSSLQDKLDKELRELDKRLQQKEAEMKQFATVDTSVLKNHFEKKVQELEQEKRAMMKEIEELRSNLASISSASDDGAQKLKGEYLQKLNVLEVQVSELKKKQDAQSQLLRQKQKSDEAAKRLQEEIQRIKSQKVQLQHKIKQESEQFRSWRAAREKEVLQLKKEGRRNEYEMHKLLSLNQRQKMVLQRKTEEAAMATKRLKELLETRKAASRETFGVGNKNGPGIQALMQAIEHEIEITVHVHEVRSEYERQKEARAAMANEVSRLKEESEMVKQKNASDCLQMMSPGARNSRIFALENMLATSSSTLVSMASQLSEVEEHERAFNNRSRWNQVRSVADAKNVMNYLFNLASSSRCLLRDKEVGCKEKDTVIRELKEKVVKLSSLVKQMEAQNAELLRQQEMQKFTSKNTMENLMNFGAQNLSTRNGRVYDLRQGPRNSIIFSNNRVNELLEDMDLSESEGSETEAVDDEWVKSVKRPVKRRASRACPLVASHPVDVQIPEKLSPESSSGEISCKIVNPASGICCSCSRGSLCKTSKCECRAASSTCGESCGCKPTKCSNREAGVMNREVDDQPLLERAEDGTNSAAASEIGRTNVLASHGAMLLQSALSLNPVEVKEDHGIQRKALSDIGNTLAKSNAPKPDRRKKWRKSVIQLVPELPPSSLPQGNETSSKPESSMVELEVPLKLPRAMKPAMTNNNFLRERNSNETHEPIANKDVGMVAPRSPQQARDSEVKENHGI